MVRVLRSPLTALRSPADDLGSVLFPSPCRICGNPLLRLSFSPVCDTCLARITPQHTSQSSSQSSSRSGSRNNLLCTRCSESLGFESWFPADQQVCETCRLAPPPFVRAVAYAVYQDELRGMLHLLKYDRVRSVAAPLGKLLAQSIATLEAASPQGFTIAAVPLFAARERQRGFNQTVLLCNAALRILRRERPSWSLVEDHSLLARQRATESQFRLSSTARRANLRGAFTVPRPHRVAGKHILLVDDIYTTGATARECTRTLLAAGAASVHVATLSRAQAEAPTLWDAASFAASMGSTRAAAAPLYTAY